MASIGTRSILLECIMMNRVQGAKNDSEADVFFRKVISQVPELRAVRDSLRNSRARYPPKIREVASPITLTSLLRLFEPAHGHRICSRDLLPTGNKLCAKAS